SSPRWAMRPRPTTTRPTCSISTAGCGGRPPAAASARRRTDRFAALFAHPAHLVAEGVGPVELAVVSEECEQLFVRLRADRQVVAADAMEGEVDHRAAAARFLDQRDQCIAA